MVQRKKFKGKEAKDFFLSPGALKQIKDFNVQLVKRLCPVATGKLKKSLKGVVDYEKKQIIVGTNIDYAGFLEWGTQKMVAAHGKHDPKNPVKDWEAKRKRGDTTSLQQMPFLRPAAYHTANEMNRIFPKKMKMKVRVVSK